MKDHEQAEIVETATSFVLSMNGRTRDPDSTASESTSEGPANRL